MSNQFSARHFHHNLVHYVRKDITFADADVSQTIGWIPAGAIVTAAYAVVQTAFDSVTSDLLDIGYAGDPNEFMTAVSIASVGKKDADELATAGNLTFTTDTEIVALLTTSGTAATAGAATIVVEYIVDNESA